jgi:tRNA-(ms[2]io[6]A)-hydroxylase
VSDGKRRLPLIQPKNDDEGEPRPPWHWAVIGAVAILLFWLPLAMLANLAVRRAVTSVVGDDPQTTADAWQALSTSERFALGAASLGGPLLAVIVAAVAGGLLVGRFGGAAGRGEATVAGLAAAALASLVAVSALVRGYGLVLWLLTSALLLTVTALAARAGAVWGLRLRKAR